MSEALIPAAANPQYDKRLYIALQVQYMLYTQIVFCFCIDVSEKFMYTTCSELGNSMYNLLSYCGLVEVRISASEEDVPVMSGVLKRIFLIDMIKVWNWSVNLKIESLTKFSKQKWQL